LKRKMKGLTRENEVVKGIYNEVVPSKVDNQSFWSRYFYRMFELKQAEDARALLVKRADKILFLYLQLAQTCFSYSN
jgi:hypothetical protein